jgi:hypothetical protein
MKLRSGSTNLLRAQDLADVIGLIRHHQLRRGFARHLDKTLRPAFRKLVYMIQQESSASQSPRQGRAEGASWRRLSAA